MGQIHHSSGISKTRYPMHDILVALPLSVKNWKVCIKIYKNVICTYHFVL